MQNVYRFYRTLLAGLLTLWLATSAYSQTIDSLQQEVERRENAFAQTLADRDFTAFQGYIAEDAVFFNGNEPIRGRAMIAEAWAPFFEGDSAPFSWQPDVVVVLDSENLALSSGPVKSPDGNDIGRFNSIWRLESDGQWRVVFDKGS